MASPTAAGDLTDLDRQFIAKSEACIADGIVLRDWCLAHTGIAVFPLNLKKVFQLPNRAVGYFGEFQLHGKTTSIMGCRQEVEFAKLDDPDGPRLLQDFVLREFLNRANWTYPDGWPGGFTITRSLYQACDGRYGKFPDNETSGAVDWRDLGLAGSDRTYRWVLLTVQIHDFVMNFGPIVKHLKEAACVVPAPEFTLVREKPAPGVKLEIQVGYPFADIAPIKNFFGFGPGKFGIAVKLYSFDLMEDNTIRVRMEFAAAPRCQKVFDFGPHIPDPIYGTAALLGKLTFGAYNPEGVHTKMDSEMLAQHSRVHQALMDGAARVWNQWREENQVQASAAQPAPK